LFQEFKLDEPWDSPHNVKLLDRIAIHLRYRAQRQGRAPVAHALRRGQPRRRGVACTSNKMDFDEALKEAKEIGLRTPGYIQKAKSYIERKKK
jgi:hypothetical protein